MSEFHAEAPQAITVSEELVQGPYLAARAGVEPMTLRTKGVDSAPPLPHVTMYVISLPSRTIAVHEYLCLSAERWLARRRSVCTHGVTTTSILSILSGTPLPPGSSAYWEQTSGSMPGIVLLMVGDRLPIGTQSHATVSTFIL